MILKRIKPMSKDELKLCSKLIARVLGDFLMNYETELKYKKMHFMNRKKVILC
jgi:hypothetical protein